jgi:hypothetical protein
MVEAEHALKRACMHCDAVHDQATTVPEDYQGRVHASTTSRWRSLEFDWILSGCQFILSVQVVDLEGLEEKLAKDQSRGLYPPNRRNLPSELVKLREHVTRTGIASRARHYPPYLGHSFMTVVG